MRNNGVVEVLLLAELGAGLIRLNQNLEVAQAHSAQSECDLFFEVENGLMGVDRHGKGEVLDCEEDAEVECFVVVGIKRAVEAVDELGEEVHDVLEHAWAGWVFEPEVGETTIDEGHDDVLFGVWLEIFAVQVEVHEEFTGKVSDDDVF